MPFQAAILQNLRGKKAIGVFDLPKCYWQFPLHPDSWDMLSFMLNGCVYTPVRVMQGHVDSALYVQSTNEECYKDLLYKNRLIWIDDIFLYADTVEEYVDALESFFDRVAQYGFKLSPAKTKLFTDQVKWCGRIISGDGVKQDPERIEHLCAIPYPTNAGELQQFVCAVNWLRDSMTEQGQEEADRVWCSVGTDRRREASV
ncbi:hypothetical protein AaE_000069 [Aphanomyces astaci]|uniref:Reverse transcriptase domain-containing protein n=1 Tax=Aphanomyces astaci TaxID=112090 RepID=A0A6A5B073_APHAT|nr:hypothetical protein AaE_000069 [Aphanomyces astaci]